MTTKRPHMTRGLQLAVDAARDAGLSEFVYRRRKFTLTECIGEAHSNAFIDNCMCCLPLWGTVLREVVEE